MSTEGDVSGRTYVSCRSCRGTTLEGSSLRSCCSNYVIVSWHTLREWQEKLDAMKIDDVKQGMRDIGRERQARP